MTSASGPLAPSIPPGREPAIDQGSSEQSGTDGRPPRHVAIIMDGNGRWAARRGLPRIAGHRAGAEAVRRTLKAAVRNGVEALTLYAFSSENWRRPEEEIADLKGLLGYYLDRELDELDRQGVRLRLIGDHRPFGKDLTARLDRAVTKLDGNDRLTLAVALNYGSRAELACAARTLAEQARAGEIDPSAIDESSIEAALQTRDLPPLDLLIRTSGEVRLSNFLLWQSAYAELVFLPTLWPDFSEQDFDKAIGEYIARERRFGGR